MPVVVVVVVVVGWLGMPFDDEKWGRSALDHLLVSADEC
jgi:hypothetical protein